MCCEEKYAKINIIKYFIILIQTPYFIHIFLYLLLYMGNLLSRLSNYLIPKYINKYYK